MEKYEALEMEVIFFESDDVITTSDTVTEWVSVTQGS